MFWYNSRLDYRMMWKRLLHKYRDYVMVTLSHLDPFQSHQRQSNRLIEKEVQKVFQYMAV